LTVARVRSLRWFAACACVLALVMVPSRSRAGQLSSAHEYEIKAGFLFSFAKFVGWPDDAFKGSGNEFRLGVLGHDPFDGVLDRLVAGKTVRNRRVVVSYFKTVPTGPPLQMVFISRSEQDQLSSILASFSGTPTLTVSDIDQFAERGGVIGMTVEKQSIRFAINRTAAGQARLELSSNLLALARLVGDSSAEIKASGDSSKF
jgi:hypothetical protein